LVAATNSQSKNSSHALLTPLLQAALDLLERAYTLTLEVTTAGDGIDWYG
jgi:hypothetical protein